MRLFLLLFLSGCSSLSVIYSQSHELFLDQGAVGLAQSLERLPLVSRVLFITAHPDDEPAGLVTYVSRGLHAKTAILTLTRGAGGQNLVGADLLDALGLVRTAEMMAANEYYGAQQYFTRAFDFGFSKSAEETLSKWGREMILGDMVRAIRSFRPQVIISIFNGTTSDGHGHHQATGILAREAYQISGDSNRFPQQLLQGLLAWQPQKLYLANVGERNPEVFSINAGQYASLLGASFQQLGAQGYRHHRSQGMGHSHASPGNYPVRLQLAEVSIPTGDSLSQEPSFHQALNLRLTSLCDVLPSGSSEYDRLRTQLTVVEHHVDQALTSFSAFDFSLCLPPLIEGLQKLRDIQQQWRDTRLSSLHSVPIQFFLADKEQDFLDTLNRAIGLSLEANIDDPSLTPGQSFRVNIKVVNRSRKALQLKGIGGESEVLRTKSLAGPFPLLQAGQEAKFNLRGEVISTALPTQTHWRRRTTKDDVYTIDDVRLINAPLAPRLMKIWLDYSYQGVPLRMEKPLEHLQIDPLKGTRRIPIHLVPIINLEVGPELHLVPFTTASRPRIIQVKVRNNSHKKVQGKLKLHSPDGWKVSPKEFLFSIPQPDQTARFQFQVSASSSPVRLGRLKFQAIANFDDAQFTEQFRMISVFDRWNSSLSTSAHSEVEALDLQIPEKLNIGYIMGPGDRVSATLTQLGISVKTLRSQDLASGQLADYDCIVAGIRVYQVRTDLVEHNARLLDYVKNGGVFLVQYNTPDTWNRGQYAPFPTRIVNRNHRVTDETAPVTVLEPQHRVFLYPNRITQEDFSGWVQERGLYFIQERDERFSALLASHDPGEPWLDGGLLVANYGKGHYILTSYSWFRQLPAGVSGAIRLFINLVSLGTSWNEAP